jgi:hypothetical protein
MIHLLIFLKNPEVPSTIYNKPSAYMVLPFSQYLFSIELERSKVKSASELALSYFPNGFHWIPEHPLKSLAFYSNILSQTKSISIKPIFCQTSIPRKIIYHSVHFCKIISEKEWGGHPSSLQKLEGFQIPFNYYDYVDAWSKFFLYQSANMDHSWFINFDKEFVGGIFPLWFSKWWSHFSLIPDVLPLGLVESFELFKTCFKIDAYGSKFPHMLHFVKQYRLPWILKWQYVIVGDNLERHWYIKWCDKFFVDPIIRRVKQMIQAPNAQNLPLPSIVSPKLITPDNIGNTPNKVMPAKESPVTSSSSKKQSSKSKKKKALLRAMALLYSLSGSDGDNDDDDDDAYEASSVAAYDPQRNYFGNSGFDSQEYVPGIEDL